MASNQASFEECPICQSQIPSEIIEEHANQCFEKQSEKIQKSPAINNKKRQINPSSTSTNYNIFNFNRTKKPKIEEEVKEETPSSSKEQKKPEVIKPLAELMRPTQFQDYVGQQKAIGEKSIIRNLLNNNTITSAIFWGPPGKLLIAPLISN